MTQARSPRAAARSRRRFLKVVTLGTAAALASSSPPAAGRAAKALSRTTPRARPAPTS